MVDLLSIPCMQSYTVINKITEGYSGDEKYKLIKDGSYFLLRVGEKKETCNSKKEFDRLKMYLHHDINTHKPICFGTTENNFYSIVSWVDGTTVMNIIKNDVCSDYYKLGIAVGNELKKNPYIF